jgi:methionyl-tRNA formyltransferase
MSAPQQQLTLRIVFAGTPEFAAAHLQSLVTAQKENHQNFEVVAVYTQPDRPAGRGKKLSASPVKELAIAHQIPVYQPVNFKSPEAIAEFTALDADLMIVVAYGLILPKNLLDIPRLGCINVHASLLPRWRGAAPIQRAIEAGDKESGVTIMQMDVGLDTGDMLLKTRCTLSPDETGSSLHDKLIQLGSPALLNVLQQLREGNTHPEKQDSAQATYANKLNKEEAALDWRLSAIELERKVRAFNPFPVAHTQLVDTNFQERIRVWKAKAVIESTTNTNAPGSITHIDEQGVWVACAEGQLIFQELQLPGKKILNVAEILRGHPELFQVGDQLELLQ